MREVLLKSYNPQLMVLKTSPNQMLLHDLLAIPQQLNNTQQSTQPNPPRVSPLIPLLFAAALNIGKPLVFKT